MTEMEDIIAYFKMSSDSDSPCVTSAQQELKRVHDFD